MIPHYKNFATSTCSKCSRQTLLKDGQWKPHKPWPHQVFVCDDCDNTITLSEEDSKILLGDIENPPEPNEALKKAARKTRKKKK